MLPSCYSDLSPYDLLFRELTTTWFHFISDWASEAFRDWASLSRLGDQMSNAFDSVNFFHLPQCRFDDWRCFQDLYFVYKCVLLILFSRCASSECLFTKWLHLPVYGRLAICLWLLPKRTLDRSSSCCGRQRAAVGTLKGCHPTI